MSEGLKEFNYVFPDEGEYTCNEVIEYSKAVITIKHKLQALEIIKQTLPIKEEDFFYDKETDTYFFIGYKVSKEKYDLLKEVLL